MFHRTCWTDSLVNPRSKQWSFAPPSWHRGKPLSLFLELCYHLLFRVNLFLCLFSPSVSCNLTSMLQFVSLPFISTLGLFLCLSCVYGHPHLFSGIDSWCWYSCPHTCAHTRPVLQCFHCAFACVCLCQHWLSGASSAILWWYMFGSVSSYSDMQTKHHSKLSLLSRKYGEWSGDRGNVI